MGLAQFRTSDEEEEVIAQRMLLRGETNRSDHFRRTYFQGAGELDSLVGEMRGEMQAISRQIEEMRKLVYRVAERESSDLEMRMMAALMVMVYPSVDTSVQAKVDKFLDMGTIEKFLSGNKGKVR
jgi:Txe/YoeB family toxin of Txe-Axe toxin-antitoxin module